MKHLPECLSADVQGRRSEAPMYGLLCICDRLEECKKRALDEGYSVGYSAAMEDGWGQPRNMKAAMIAALDAALGAIDRLPAHGRVAGALAIDKAKALAAINALREK